MKKTCLIFMFLLTCCAPAISDKTETPKPVIPSPELPLSVRESYPPDIDAFEVSEKCPNLCWMGIHPGATTRADALVLLQESAQIKQKSIQSSGDSIQAVWFTDETNTIVSRVGIRIEDNLVSGISLPLLNFTLNDFIGILGEPDEISISLEETPDAWFIIPYTTYYNSSRVMLHVNAGNPVGPDPDDYVHSVRINIPFDDKNMALWLLDDYEKRQPWLGYGHISEYLPGVEIPEAHGPAPLP